MQESSDALDVYNFAAKWAKKYAALLGADSKRSKVALKACLLEPTRSVHYGPMLEILRRHDEDAVFDAKALLRLLIELGYPLSNEEGDSKGRARDYFFVIESFCSGKMKTSRKSEHELDVSDVNFLHSDLHAVKTRVASFEKRSGDSGHGRMVHALKFVMLMQLRKALEVIGLETGGSS